MFDLLKLVRKSLRQNGGALNMAYNDESGGLKTLTVNGYLVPVTSAVSTDNPASPVGSLIAFYNGSAATAYAAFSTPSAVGAPAKGSGVAIPPYSYMTLTVPEKAFAFRVSSADVEAYFVKDSTVLA